MRRSRRERVASRPKHEFRHIPGQINVRAAYANGIIKNLQTLCGDPALPLVRPHITKLTSRTPILIAIAILFIGVFGLDYSAGRELNLWLLYIVPIALGTFAMGPRSGVVMSCLAGALLCLNGYLLRNPYSSDFAFLVDRASDVVAYLLIVSLIGVARGRYQAFKTEVKHAAGLPD